MLPLSPPALHSAKQKLLCATCVLLALLCTALACTVNTGTNTCKSAIQHCNTPLTGICVWEKNKIRARGCHEYLRPVWYPNDHACRGRRHSGPGCRSTRPRRRAPESIPGSCRHHPDGNRHMHHPRLLSVSWSHLPSGILLSTHAEGAGTVGPAAAAHVHGAGHQKTAHTRVVSAPPKKWEQARERGRPMRPPECKHHGPGCCSTCHGAGYDKKARAEKRVVPAQTEEGAAGTRRTQTERVLTGGPTTAANVHSARHTAQLRVRIGQPLARRELGALAPTNTAGPAGLPCGVC